MPASLTLRITVDSYDIAWPTAAPFCSPCGPASTAARPETWVCRQPRQLR